MSEASDRTAPFGAVIVIHNSARYLPGLFDSIERHIDPAPELVVVDTGSTDGGAELARARGARIIDRPDNPGFGVSNNVAVHELRSEMCVLLNPDIELLDDGLLALVELARGRRALLVPRLLNTDGSLQRSAHPPPGKLESLLPALIHPLALPRSLRMRADPWRTDTTQTVGWALAACLVAQTALLRKLGPFDPDIFLFYEDLDFALRAARDGIPTELHPEVNVRHHGSHSTFPAYGGEPYQLLAGLRRQVIASQLGRRALAIDDAAQLLAFGTRAGARIVLRRDASRELSQLRALRAARRDGVPS
jgi:N-acetylglucosaminyl-diphospho-decaprenol L-rhamnosyltransferase